MFRLTQHESYIAIQCTVQYSTTVTELFKKESNLLLVQPELDVLV